MIAKLDIVIIGEQVNFGACTSPGEAHRVFYSQENPNQFIFYRDDSRHDTVRKLKSGVLKRHLEVLNVPASNTSKWPFL